jgi:hypothetical protein
VLLGISNLVAVTNADADADAMEKKVPTLCSEMYDKLSKFTVYVIVDVL